MPQVNDLSWCLNSIKITTLLIIFMLIFHYKFNLYQKLNSGHKKFSFKIMF